MNTELILVNISGYDRPGVTAALTDILARYDASILDIGQADIHHTLSLGILFKTSGELSGNIMKDLLFKASELNVQIRFTPVPVGEYEEWVTMQGKNRWIVTILGRQLTARQIAAVTSIIAEQQLNIDGIQRLTGRVPSKPRNPPEQRPAWSFQCEAIHATSAVCRASSCACRQPKISIYPSRRTPCTDVAADSCASIWTLPLLRPR